MPIFQSKAKRGCNSIGQHQLMHQMSYSRSPPRVSITWLLLVVYRRITKPAPAKLFGSACEKRHEFCDLKFLFVQSERNEVMACGEVALRPLFVKLTVRSTWAHIFSSDRSTRFHFVFLFAQILR